MLPCSVVVVFLADGSSSKRAESANQAMGKINTVYNALYYNYYKDVSQQKLVDGALNGMVEALGDPFTEYMNKTESQELNDSISGSFGGIGPSAKKWFKDQDHGTDRRDNQPLKLV